MDISGTGNHLPKIDAKIRQVKETAKEVVAGLPYKLPKVRVKDQFTYVINSINTRRTSALNDNICPRVRFTERKIDYRRESLLDFSDYVEAFDTKVRLNNMTQKRTEPCIAL